MPKYFTPPSAIRFANVSQVAFKSMAMTVESCIFVTSDKGFRNQDFSGVIRFRRDDWKRYTVVWLYGDSIGAGQDFVQPAVSDVSCSDYPENFRVGSPVSNSTLYVTGTNFNAGMKFVLGGTQLTATVYDRHSASLVLPTWAYEQENVPLRAVRQDYRSSTDFDGFSFEFRPIVSGVSQTGTFIDGFVALSFSGDHFKFGSNVLFSSGSASVLSNNSTFFNSSSIGTFAPPLPATGVYAVQVISPSGLSSSVVPASHVTCSYRRPVITHILPFNTGSVAGSSSLVIEGGFFLSGAQVSFGASGALTQTVVSQGEIDVVSPPHGQGQVLVTVTNPQDSQTSVGFPYQYVVPVPTITDANFPGNTVFTKKTGSAGSTLSITGTNFTGSDALMTVTQVTLASGAFVTASTNFIIQSPTVLSMVIPALTTGSNYDVSVSNSAGTATLTSAFQYQDVPLVTSVSPTSGTTAGGLFVLISGRPFYAGASQAKFGGVLGSAQTVYSIDQMSALTPQAGNLDGGLVTVSVQNYGSIEGGLSGAFEYVPFPTASFIRSSKGNNRVPAESVSTVTLVGTRFLADRLGTRGTTIKLSSQAEEIVTSFIDNTQVSFNVQPHAAGFVSLTATNREIAPSAPLANAIEYVNTPTITSLSAPAAASGSTTTLAITGTNFIDSANTAVLIGTTPCSTTVASSTNLTFIVPANLLATTYNVTVVNKQTTVSNAVPIQIIGAPAIFALSVTSGTNAGGTTVVVNGINFISGVMSASITGGFGNFPLSLNFISTTQFSFVTPPVGYLNRGFVTLNLTELTLTASAPNAFRFEQAPAITSLNPASALTSGTTSVQISGSGFINLVSTVSVDGVNISAVVSSDTIITFTAPVHATGNATVAVTNVFLSSSNNLNYVALPPAIISNIVVGTVTASVVFDANAARFSVSGGLLHYNSGTGYADQLLGQYFTPQDVISVIPFDGSPTMTPPITYISSNKLGFTMPAHAAGECYIVVTNVDGVSNYAYARWNARPVITKFTPPFVAYNSNGYVVTASGSNFISGETWMEKINGPTRMPTTVINSSTLQFAWSTVGASTTDWANNVVYANNSSSMPGEAGWSAFIPGLTIAFPTVNPPSVNSILQNYYPITQGGTTALIVPSDPTLLGYIPPGNSPSGFPTASNYTQTPLRLFLNGAIGTLTNRNTTDFPGNTGSHYVWPSSFPGQNLLQFGYAWDVGTNWNHSFLGTGMYVNYVQVNPISISKSLNPTQAPSGTGGTVNLTKSVNYMYPAAGTNQISAVPLYLHVNGGVPPYTVAFSCTNQLIGNAPFIYQNMTQSWTYPGGNWTAAVTLKTPVYNVQIAHASFNAYYQFVITDALGTVYKGPYTDAAVFFATSFT